MHATACLHAAEGQRGSGTIHNISTDGRSASRASVKKMKKASTASDSSETTVDQTQVSDFGDPTVDDSSLCVPVVLEYNRSVSDLGVLIETMKDAISGVYEKDKLKYTFMDTQVEDGKDKPSKRVVVDFAGVESNKVLKDAIGKYTEGLVGLEEIVREGAGPGIMLQLPGGSNQNLHFDYHEDSALATVIVFPEVHFTHQCHHVPHCL